MYHLCEKYYIAYYRDSCVSWVSRLTVGLKNKLNLTDVLSE